jgi:hypothetical protein
MSTGNSLVETGGGGVVSHDCENETGRNPYARVTVDGTRIPVINEGVRTEVRKDGAMGLTRHSEVYFPREWSGETYTPAVRALDPNEANVYDPVDIEVRDHVTDEYHTVHRGFVMGVGGGSNGEKEYRMTVGDVGQLLSAIPFEGTYGPNTHLFKVIGDIVGRVRDTIVPQVFDTVAFEPVGNIESELVVLENKSESAFGQIFQNTLAGKVESAASGWLFDNNKQFADNKNSCADALEWVGKHLDGIFYFEPHEDNAIKLVFDTTDSTTTLTAQHLQNDDDAVNIRNAIPYEDTKNFTVLRVRNIDESEIELTNGHTLVADFYNGTTTDVQIQDSDSSPSTVRILASVGDTVNWSYDVDGASYKVSDVTVYFSDALPNQMGYRTITIGDTNRRVGVAPAPFSNFAHEDEVTDPQPLLFIESGLLDDPSTVVANANSTRGDQPIHVYRNNALHEIRPLNQYIVNGARTDRENKYPIATATHEPLLKRASMPLTNAEHDDSVNTITAAENTARKRLKDALDETALGTIITAPSPLADPYTTIVSQPACGRVRRETPPFKYEVESVVHKISASDEEDNRRHETQINASLVIDKQDITVNSEYEQTTEKSKSNWERGWDAAKETFGPLTSPFFD